MLAFLSPFARSCITLVLLSIDTRCWRRAAAPAPALLLALGLAMLIPEPARALEALSAPGLLAKYAELGPRLRNNQFRSALALDSVETSGISRGDVYAVVDHPFADVSAAMANQANWCDILILHLNVKYCRGIQQGAATALDVRLGRKFDEPIEKASRLAFGWHLVAATPDYFNVTLDAPSGPFGTRDYRMVVEGVSIDSRRTFIHMGYAFSYGSLGQLAMSTYFNTIGRDKVGFSSAGPAAAGEAPRYVQGMRGLTERNTMRYYLAIEAYLNALTAAPAEQLNMRLEGWFMATEKYATQLHEMDRAAYLAMKRGEVKRQQTAP